YARPSASHRRPRVTLSSRQETRRGRRCAGVSSRQGLVACRVAGGLLAKPVVSFGVGGQLKSPEVRRRGKPRAGHLGGYRGRSASYHELVLTTVDLDARGGPIAYLGGLPGLWCE